jgi:hypothetical protein
LGAFQTCCKRDKDDTLELAENKQEGLCCGKEPCGWIFIMVGKAKKMRFVVVCVRVSHMNGSVMECFCCD